MVCSLCLRNSVTLLDEDFCCVKNLCTPCVYDIFVSTNTPPVSPFLKCPFCEEIFPPRLRRLLFLLSLDYHSEPIHHLTQTPYT